MHTPSVNKVDVIDKRITNFFDKCDRLRSVRKIMLCNVNSQNKYHFLIETSKFADTIASESSARVLGRNHLIMKLAPARSIYVLVNFLDPLPFLDPSLKSNGSIQKPFNLRCEFISITPCR